MEIRALTVFSLLVAFGVCKGLVLVGEEKRQGLIPFPRVGRTPSWLQSFPSYFQDEQDAADFDVTDDDGLLAVRFTRGLFAPRLGRRKRSPSTSDESSSATASSESGDGRHVRATPSLIPRYLYDADGNQVNVRNLLRRSPWAIITYKDGMEKKMAFNPRLGRAMVPRLGRKRSSESSAAVDVTQNEEELAAADEKRAMAFSPRLGRADGYTTTSQTRGGRAFSPRLGRSDVNAVENDVDQQQSSA